MNELKCAIQSKETGQCLNPPKWKMTNKNGYFVLCDTCKQDGFYEERLGVFKVDVLNMDNLKPISLEKRPVE